MPLTEREAVLQTVEEFDQIGRDAFLERYGFRAAREYFLFHKGKFYDSKAILGVSHRHSSASGEILAANTFSGGEATVEKSLKRLGFTVLRIAAVDTLPPSASRTVILTWNPQNWQWPDHSEVVARVKAGEAVQQRWSCGNTRTLPVATRAFLLRQGEEPRGLIGSGWTISTPYEAEHWDKARASNGEVAFYVDVLFDAVVPPSALPIDPRLQTGPLSRVNWSMPASGTSISGDQADAIEELWASTDTREVDGSLWSREELTASVVAYLEMGKLARRNEKFVKADVYRELAARFGRSPKSIEYRMQNISYVMSLIGRPWLPGLRPARNVGVKNAAEIESILAELENRESDPNVAFETRVATAIAKGKADKPDGNESPDKSVGTRTVYERDPEVKAWVLLNASGICECCNRAAPFATPDGPFLEVHHVWRLADSGPDTVENAVALCPNCHRELHHGVNAPRLIAELYSTVPRLVPAHP